MKTHDPLLDAVIRLIDERWPASDGPNEFRSLLLRAAKQKTSCTLAQYLDALARHHDLVANAFRLAARAAQGEDLTVLASENIAPPIRIKPA